VLKRIGATIVQGLVVMLGSCLATDWRAASAQQPQASVPAITDQHPVADPENQLTPLPDGLPEGMLGEAGFQDDALPADCGLGCPPSWYYQADAVYMANESNGPVSLSDNMVLPEFSYDWGLRLTFGRKRDCLDGWEVSYTGLFEWSVEGEAAGALLSSKFVVPAADVNVSAFNDAAFHRQTYESTLHNAELNRRWWDWDTMSCLIGLRYVNIDEEFNFYSRDPLPAPDEGLFTVETTNRLVGPQCGVDFLQTLGPGGYLQLNFRSKLGAYANFAEGDVRLVNAGIQELNNDDTEVQFAALWELGFLGRLQLTRHLSVRGGYEAWYVYGVALAEGQTVFPLSVNTGTSLTSDNDTWYHGATVGIDVVW